MVGRLGRLPQCQSPARSRGRVFGGATVRRGGLSLTGAHEVRKGTMNTYVLRMVDIQKFKSN